MTVDFSSLPAPVDDGAADHLLGLDVPPIPLTSTIGDHVDLAQAAQQLLVVYVYPRTGTPGEALPEGWDDIPGARGCTAQSCSFRDAQADLAARGASLVGISIQTPEEQREFAERERINYPLLSDHELRLAEAMRLPTFEAGGLTLYKRLTFVAQTTRIVKVFYPVFPPDRNAADVLAWLDQRQNG